MIKINKDLVFLKKAIEKSKESVKRGGYPVGAALVMDGKIISYGFSDGKNLKDATSHAEIDAIRKASKRLDSRDLKGAVLYSSMEPCLMCFSASFWADISKIVYACSREKVSKLHYEGRYNLAEIGKKFKRKIVLSHLKEMEKEALDVIKEWEKLLRLCV